MAAWQAAEGGWNHNTATFNPFNTSRDAPGARSFNGGASAVKAYPDFNTGVQQTVETLQLPYYKQILATLNGPTQSFAQAVYASPWGTKRGIANVPAVGGAGVVPAASSAPTPAPPTPGTMSPAAANQAAGFDPRKFALSQLSQMALGSDRVGGRLSPFESFQNLVTARAQAATAPTAPPAPVAGLASNPSMPTVESPGPAPHQKGEYVLSKYGTSPVGGGYKPLGTPFQGTHGKAFNQKGGSDNWQSENAWDLGVPVGTPIFATEDGVIDPGRYGSLGSGGRFAGLRVTLHGGDNSFYFAHLSRIAVKPGAHVKAGQLIGYSGEANGVPHLHYAVENL